MKKIAIVNSSSFGKHFPEHIIKLEKIGKVEFFNFNIDATSEELFKKLFDFDYIISSVTPFFKKDFFKMSSKLKLISRHGIGYNNIDLKAASESGVYVSKVSALVEQSAVAENALALFMAILRQTPQGSKAVKEGKWASRAKFMGYELREKYFGVIGCGNIGSRVAEIFKGAFNCKVLAYDPFKTSEEISACGAEKVELYELISKCRFISLNASLNESSYHILNDDVFNKMIDGTYIVNTARGALWDEDALCRALESGKIAGVGTDVIEDEPIDEKHRLLKYENVYITPHTSAYTYECLKGMGDKCVDDILRVDRGEKPLELVNVDVLNR